MLYPIDRQGLSKARAAYRLLSQISPDVIPACEKIRVELERLEGSLDVFKAGQNFYSRERGTPSAFVRFSQQEMSVTVESASDELGGKNFSFSSEVPPQLMSRSLIERVSLHIPTIVGIEKQSIDDRILASQGRRAFGVQKSTVQIIDEANQTVEEVQASNVVGLMPSGCDWQIGALLITPLGIEKSTEFGFGFIYEYREDGPFSLKEVKEARALSSLFALQIVKKVLAER